MIENPNEGAFMVKIPSERPIAKGGIKTIVPHNGSLMRDNAKGIKIYYYSRVVGDYGDAMVAQ